jgi:hypothetical protein
MKQYQYVVAKFVPSAVRAESLNVGLALQDLSTGQMMVKFTEKLELLRLLSPEVSTQSMAALVGMLKRGLDGTSKFNGYLATLSERTRGVICFSEVKSGIAEDLSERMDSLFNEFVSIEHRNDVLLGERKIRLRPHRQPSLAFEGEKLQDLFPIEATRKSGRIVESGPIVAFSSLGDKPMVAEEATENKNEVLAVPSIQGLHLIAAGDMC